MNTMGTRRFAVTLLLLAAVTTSNLIAAESPSLTDQAKQAGAETRDAVDKAVASTKDSFDNLWRSVDENRLKNRTPDEVVAWAIMGVLAGAVAGMFTQLKPSGLGKLGRLLLGLGGAFVGGMVVHVAKLDFGWGPVLIRYEDLLFSLLGALLLIVIGRVLRSKSKKKA
jgi:uncharacterized membrane protein YeaQ/YmgE (transglycosylase-associated protein family)